LYQGILAEYAKLSWTNYSQITIYPHCFFFTSNGASIFAPAVFLLIFTIINDEGTCQIDLAVRKTKALPVIKFSLRRECAIALSVIFKIRIWKRKKDEKGQENSPESPKDHYFDLLLRDWVITTALLPNNISPV